MHQQVVLSGLIVFLREPESLGTRIFRNQSLQEPESSKTRIFENQNLREPVTKRKDLASQLSYVVSSSSSVNQNRRSRTSNLFHGLILFICQL